MMKLASWLVFLFLSFLMVASARMAVAQTGARPMCSVMPDEPIKKKFYVDFEDKRIYLCCRNCVKAFKKKPYKYLPNVTEDSYEVLPL